MPITIDREGGNLPIRMPDYFKEVTVGETDKEKIDTLKKYNGRMALVLDEEQEGYYHLGSLEVIKGDNECYFLNKGDETRRFHFHDLEKLLVAHK